MTKLALPFAWIVLTFSTALLIFRTDLHSDLLFLDSIAVDIFDKGGSWSDWNITTAPAYFPDMLVYALSYFLVPTPAVRVVFVSIVQALLLALACVRLAKSMNPENSGSQALFILLCASAFSLVAANSSMWLFFNSTNNHFASVLFPLLIGHILFQYFDRPTRWRAFLILTFVFSGASSTPVFTLVFTIPFFLTSVVVFFLVRNRKDIRNTLFSLCGYVFLGQLAALIFNKIAVSYDTFGGRVPVTIDAAERSLGFFWEATKYTVGPGNIFTFMASIFSIFALGVVILDPFVRLSSRIERMNNSTINVSFVILTRRLRYNCVTLFFLISLPTSVVGSVVSGGFVDVWGYRYLSLPIAVGLVMFVVRFDELVNVRMSKIGLSPRLLGVILLSVISVLGISSLERLYKGTRRDTMRELLTYGVKNSGDDIAKCIATAAASGFSFEAGAADYWNARGVEYKARDVAFILPVTNDMKPFFWMSTLGPMRNSNIYGAQKYNFLIVRKSGSNTPFNMTRETIGEKVPPPSRIVGCKNTDSNLWLYDGSQLDEFMHEKIMRFLLQLGLVRNFSLTGAAFLGQTGSEVSNSRVAISGDNGPGFLAYGPYIRVPRGKYRAVISYEATEDGNKWDAGRFNSADKNVTLASGALPVGGGSVKFDFDLEQPVDQFEVRLWFGGAGSLALHSVSIESRE